MKKELSHVGFSRQTADPTDQEVYDMIDDVIFQTLGAEGLRKIIKPSDKVVLKVNLVGPYMGERGEKGRGIITDPRVVRHVADRVREIIGFSDGASLKVVDAVMYSNRNPSLKSIKTSFYWAKLERTGDNAVDEEDYCYDFNADGILDGDSKAELVNLDAIGTEGRELFEIPMESGRVVKVSFPKFLRTKEQAEATDTPEEYCDVLIALPILKSHGIEGITGALKLHYGIRSRYGMPNDQGRYGHSGMYYDEQGNHNTWKLTEYLCAMHKVRSYDYCIMDCITANRKGPTLPVGGISYLPTTDQKTDYIISSAMMASLDPVALDTAEAALAGYEISSIPILPIAAKNNLGQNNPALIRIEGNSSFSLHRKFLWHIHNQRGQKRYPLEHGWGGAQAMETVEPLYNVDAKKPKKITDNIYEISYRIIKERKNQKRKITRVELVANSELIAGKIGNHLEEGNFLLDLSKHPDLKNTDIAYNVLAWDDSFNCVASIERFILQ
ncbi:MAG: DUF362 domain-containing protein [Defluviitaleaceae bacterium]|nr:DUF362 domain-containing protein [Defluviitaleaceae bacterium]